MPAFSIAESCAVPDAVAADVEFTIVQVLLTIGPTPSPSGPVAAGEIDASVTATLPWVATENVNVSELFGAREPVNVSVVELPVEDDEEPPPNRSLSGLVQADAKTEEVRIRNDRKSLETFMLALIGTGAPIE